MTAEPSRWTRFALPAAWTAWLLVFVAFGLQGFNLREDGYILTLAERMARGEIPYRDFSYIRPPLPIAIQAALLQAIPGYAVPESRWYFAGQVVVILTAVYALLSRVEPSRWTRATYAFLAVAFSYTGGFPPMPWHTLDGVFF